jgi:hypothetical protein
MQSFTHRGDGILGTLAGPASVSYVLTVIRTDTALEGYGHVQSKAVDFARLLMAGAPLDCSSNRAVP